MNIRDTLSTMQGGRFAKLVDALDGLDDVCGKCNYFNPTIQDPLQGYRCHVMGSCPAATLHPNLQQQMHKELGWIKK